ncbi:MAG TPA: amylo-alpha-1,6-glucosidase [Pyrinomonadaceae bacterium]|nr:amylo-alpha-1,6-glucosidase [Pyrinomonadaceae bacterium]
MIRLRREELQDFDAALGREWLETNGLGGFASSTPYGLNTRRYHGLLVAATRPPVGRIVLLSKLEETLIIDGRRFDLSANQYPGTIHPEGHRLLQEFRLDPFPIFTYLVEGVVIEKSVFMLDGENSTVVQYKLVEKEKGASNNSAQKAAHDIQLELRPLVAFRDYHSLAHETGSINRSVEMEKGLATVKLYAEIPALYLAYDADELDSASYWYRNFEYRAERERGFDFTEDLYNPFALRFDLSSRSSANVIASTEPRDAARADAYRRRDIERRQKVIATAGFEDEFLSSLVAAADQFIVARNAQKTIIAGYHWFSDWGRDTMIALPGLTLLTGRAEIARSVLLEFAQHVDCGMLPNRFPDAGEVPEYNTVDATLWYFEAVRALLEHTNDYEFVRDKLYDVLVDIINWHVKGTRYDIHADDDGLLYSGADGVQLTWMDARVGNRVVTPRGGKPVEIQALWYNALRMMEELARKFNDTTSEKRFCEMAGRACESFNRLFWNEELGCLYDAVDGNFLDASMRPNQIFAVSLHHTMLPYERAKQVVEAVRRELLTPLGLRSLSPNDPQYAPVYTGGPEERDARYHQGTVWAWLMGPFIIAYLKIYGEDKTALEQAAAWLKPFHEHLRFAGLGSVSEIFDGDAPHTPRGCIAQAWSVAELLRALNLINS